MPTTGDLINLDTLVLTDTFNTWLNRTNQIVDTINPLQVYDVDVGAGSTTTETGAGLAKYTGQSAGNYNGVITIGLNPGPGVGFESLSGQSRTVIDFAMFDDYGRILTGQGISGAITRVASSDEYIVNDVSDTLGGAKPEGVAKKVKARNMLPPEIAMDSLTISGNLIVLGNLSTYGANDYIAANDLRIEDKQIELAYQQAIPLTLTGVTSGTFPLAGGPTAYYFTTASTLTHSFYGHVQSFTGSAVGPTGSIVIGSLFGSLYDTNNEYGPEDFGATGYISLNVTGANRYLYISKGGITSSFLTNVNLDEGGLVLKGSQGDKSWLWIWTDNDTGRYYDSWQTDSNIGVNGSTYGVISRVYRSYGYTGTDQTKSQFIFTAESGNDAEIYIAETENELAPLNFTGGAWKIAKRKLNNYLVFSAGATGISGTIESFYIVPGPSGTVYSGIPVNNYAKNLNVDLLDGAHASTTASAYAIPVADAYGRINGDFLNADAVRRRYTQTNHGLTFGMAVRILPSTGGFTSAVATSAEYAEAIGIVSAVHSSNEFTVTHQGKIDNILGSSMTLEGVGFTAGNVYFLGASANNRGKLIADPDYAAATRIATGQIRKPLLLAISATQGYVLDYVGTKVPTATDQVYLYGLVPVGTIQAYAGSLANLTSEWLLCDGDRYRALDYPELYNTIVKTYEAKIEFAASGTTGMVVGGARNITEGDTYKVIRNDTGVEYSATVASGGVNTATGVITFTSFIDCGSGTHRFIPSTNSLGETIFFVPDLRTRSIVGGSTGDSNYSSVGLSAYTLAEYGGSENFALGPGTIPAHTHTTTTISANVVSGSQTLITSVGSGGIAATGDSISNRDPYLVTHYIIRAKAETGATILTGHNHDGRYHFLNDNMKISANGNYRGFPSVAGFTGFNVYADSALLGRTAYILSCFVPTTPYTGVLQNDSRTKTNMVGDLTIWGTGLTALNGATGAHRPTFTFSTHAAALYIEGGTANMPAPYIDFYTDGAGPQGSVRGLTLPAADTHAANKYYSDTSNKTIALTTPTGEWSVKHNALALNRSAQSSKILTVGYNQNLAVSGLDSVCQTTVYGDFTVYGDGLTTGTNKTGHSSVTFAVDPLSSSVSIEGSSNNPGKPAPALVFVNSSNNNNPIGIIAGLTAPTTNDRAANKWYVDSKIPKLCFYNVNVGGDGASFNSTTTSPTFGTLTPGLYMIIINGTARDISSVGDVGYTIQGLGTGGTPSYNVFTRYPGDPSAYQPLTLGAYVQVGTGSSSGFTVTSYSNPINGNAASIYIASIVATRISD
jgi:hypothetical protein